MIWKIAALSGVVLLARPAGAQSFSVVNSASRQAATTAATGVAPGSLCDFVVGSLFAPIGPLAATDTVTLQLRPARAQRLDLTTIAIEPASGVPRIITALVPPDAPVGPVQAAVISKNTGREFTRNIFITASSFGLFTRGRTGIGTALANRFRDRAELVGLTTPVRTGDWVTLWGTGLGDLSELAVFVSVGNSAVAASYGGPAPGFPGLDQVNFLMPPTAEDCYVRVWVAALPGPPLTRPQNPLLQEVSLPVANSTDTCKHRLGLTPEQLRVLDSGQTLLAPTATVASRLTSGPPGTDSYRRAEEIYVPFSFSDQSVFQSLTGIWEELRSGCTIDTSVLPTTVRFSVDNADREVTGPGGFRAFLPTGIYSSPGSNTPYPLNSVPLSIFVPGEWRLVVTGGVSLPFETPLRVPPPIRWNREGLTAVSRANDLTLRWNPEGYTDNEWMLGVAALGNTRLSCSAPATAGSVTLPAGWLAQLPQAGSQFLQLALELLPSPLSPVSFSVPRATDPPGRGVTNFSYSETIQVEFR